MAESVNSSGACKKPASSVEAPPPPEDMVEELPSDYVARKCKRCGTFSTTKPKYNQLLAPESKWKSMTAWESGSVGRPTGNHCLLCRKTADYGGFLAKFGTVAAMDKALDQDINLQHEFLQSRNKLEQLKIETPGLRVTAGNNMLKERLVATETTKQGIKAPKVQFMELSVYRKTHGEPAPGAIKSIVFRGRRIEGVDVQKQEDVGIYEYVDEEENTMSRTTQLNDEDINIGRNTEVFNVAVNRMQNSGVYASSAQPVMIPQDTQSRSNGEESSATRASSSNQASLQQGSGFYEPDDEDDENFNPFANLFGRLSTTKAEDKAKINHGNGQGDSGADDLANKRVNLARNSERPAKVPRAKSPDEGDEDMPPPPSVPPPSTAKAEKKPKEKGKRAKKNVDESVEERKRPRPGPELPDGDEGDAAITAEDAELLQKFQLLTNDFDDMDPASAKDEGSFRQWLKDRVAAMGDVKNSLSTKIKSVKRRKSSSAQATCGKLEDISAALNEKSEFLKKIQDGKTEGLYADVNAFGSEVKISPHIWKKIIKGIAHEDLKVANFDKYFGDTFSLCQNQLADEHLAFFTGLTGQLLAKLVKGIPQSKAITADSLKYLKNFVDSICKHAEKAGNAFAADDPESDAKAVSDLKLIVDFTSAPAKVLQLKADEIAASNHWAIAPFASGPGKRIVEAARENANRREVFSKVLEEVEAQVMELQCAMGGTNESELDIDNPDDVKKYTGCDIGTALGNAHVFLHTKNFKQLKGTDRECLSNLNSLYRKGMCNAIGAHLHDQMLPGLQCFNRGLEEHDVVACVLLSDDSCISKLPSGAQVEPAIQGLKDFSAFFKDLTTDCQKMCQSCEESAETIQSKLAKWSKQASSLEKSLSNFLGGLGADSAVSAVLVGNVKNALSETAAHMKDFLEWLIGRKAAQVCIPCLDVLAAAMKGQLPEKDTLQKFDEAIEKSNLMSSILGQGHLLREGLSIVNEAVKLSCLLGDLSIEENKYKAIKAGLVFEKFGSADVSTRMAYIQKITGYEVVDMCETIPSFVSELNAKVAEHLAILQSQIDGEFHSLELPDLEVPEECETVSDLNSEVISTDFLEKHFHMDSIKVWTEMCLSVKNALDKTESISSKCGRETLVDVSSFRIRYQKAMRYLCIGNLLFCLNCKAVKRACEKKMKISKSAQENLNSALAAIRENSLEVPGGLQAIVTQITMQ